MSLEDRVSASVDQAVRSLVQQVLVDATADRNTAVSTARDEAFAEAEQAAEARLADAHAAVEALAGGERRAARGWRRSSAGSCRWSWCRRS